MRINCEEYSINGKIGFWHVPASHLRAATKNITWIDWNSLLKLAI